MGDIPRLVGTDDLVWLVYKTAKDGREYGVVAKSTSKSGWYKGSTLKCQFDNFPIWEGDIREL